MTNRSIIIGSRGSELALWQAHFVQNELKKQGVVSEIKIIKTQGDKIQNLSFDKMEGKGFFTKEIEEALLNRSIDLAVHSHKDLETSQPEGLKIAAVSDRANPCDVLLIRENQVDTSKPYSLTENAVVGTSSARRKSQILALCPGVQIKDIRGNVPTRIAKLQNGDFDAILLAAAGLERITPNLDSLIKVELPPKIFIPAPAQGVLGYQIRENEIELEEILRKLNDETTEKKVAIERSVLKNLDGGCQLPLGVYCIEENETLKVYVSYAKTWDSKVKNYIFDASSPEETGRHIAETIATP